MKNIIALLLGIFMATPVFAINVTDITKTDTGNDTWYIGQWDKLALDFVIPSNGGKVDTLNAITIKNQGTAYYSAGIKNLRLWGDAGQKGFQGWGTDTDLGIGTYRGVESGWYWNNLTTDVGPDGGRFFVTVETWPFAPATQVNYTVQMAIHGLNDVNGNGSFDVGDTGIFMASGSNGISDGLIANSTNQTISYANSDREGPTVIFTNIYDNIVLNASSNTIQGKARDQGNSSPESVFLSIIKPGESPVWKLVENTGVNFSEWKYDWTGIKEGNYYIQAKSSDFLGYQATTEPILVQVNLGGNLSQSFSSLTADKTTAVAGGMEKITITAKIRNEDDYPITGRVVELQEVREDANVTVSTAGTGLSGIAEFKIGVIEPGLYKFRVIMDDEQVGSIMGFTFVDKSSASAINYEVGRWVKRPDMTAVYFLDSNNIRHAYPVQAVWESYFGKSFTRVETIDADTMATYSLGKNVPFKSGSIIKLPTIPKVYKVNGTTLHWLTTEAVAQKYYGASWASQISAIPDSFFTDYTVGSNITN